MNPQEQDPSQTFELSPAARSTEQGGQALPEKHQVSTTDTQGNIAIEHGISQQTLPSAPQQLAPLQAPSDGQASAQDDSSSGSAVANVGTPQIADDTDLIEKEWVIKAKEIVAKTSHDPHLQNQEMNKFKADYLKKRYNKDIKLSEDT